VRYAELEGGESAEAMQAHCADGVVVAGGYSVGEVDGDREEVVRIQGAVRTWFWFLCSSSRT
jgi:hypothetical protein